MSRTPEQIEKLAYDRAVERNWNPDFLETRRVGEEIMDAVKFGFQEAKESEDEEIQAMRTEIEQLKQDIREIYRELSIAQLDISSDHIEDVLVKYRKYSTN